MMTQFKNQILSQDEVKVFLCHLRPFFPYLKQLRALLDQTEKTKADRFYFEKHRERYTASQGLLRIFLSWFTELEPEHIQFEKNSYGKPFIKDHSTHFNISHSHEYAIYAFSTHHELGIDIEEWKERTHLDGIIDSNFSSKEQTQYHSLPEELKIPSFYQGWTCNEAIIKAIGMGLSFPLEDFSVEMDPRKPLNLIELKENSFCNQHWLLHKLPCPKEYSAALAVSHKDLKINSKIIYPSDIKQF